MSTKIPPQRALASARERIVQIEKAVEDRHHLRAQAAQLWQALERLLPDRTGHVNPFLSERVCECGHPENVHGRRVRGTRRLVHWR